MTMFSAMAPSFTDMSSLAIALLHLPPSIWISNPVSITYILKEPFLVNLDKGFSRDVTLLHILTNPEPSSQSTGSSYSLVPVLLLPSISLNMNLLFDLDSSCGIKENACRALVRMPLSA